VNPEQGFTAFQLSPGAQAPVIFLPLNSNYDPKHPISLDKLNPLSFSSKKA
jgi:hypothetical protein